MKGKLVDKILLALLIVSIMAFIIINSLYVHNDLIQSSKSIMFSEINNLGKSTEAEFSKFINDAEFYASTKAFDEFYSENYFSTEEQGAVRMLLANYEELLTRVVVSGPNKSVELVLEGMNHMKISDINEKFPARELKHSRIYDDGTTAYYIVPIRINKNEAYQVYFQLDIEQFLTAISKNYYFGNRMWTWYLDKDDTVKCLAYSDGSKNREALYLDDIDYIKDRVLNGLMDIYDSTILFGEEVEVLTAFYPLNFNGENYVIGVSLDKDDLLDKLLNESLSKMISSMESKESTHLAELTYSEFSKLVQNQFTAVEEDLEFFQLIFDDESIPYLQTKFSNVVKHHMSGGERFDNLSKKRQVYITFLSSGLAGLMKFWLKNKDIYSSEEMTAIVIDIYAEDVLESLKKLE